MEELLKALKNRRGAKIIIIDSDSEMEDPSVENLEDVDQEMSMEEKKKSMLGFEPFSNLKEKDPLEMNKEEDDDDELEEDAELSGMDKEVMDERIMTRLKNGKKPASISEKMQYNLMKKK